MSETVQNPKCQHLLGNLSDYIDGELQAELCAELEAHMDGCENCRIVVDTLRKTVELCRENNEAVELPQDVRERLFNKLNMELDLKNS